MIVWLFAMSLLILVLYVIVLHHLSSHDDEF
jgi:hypothetical protein